MEEEIIETNLLSRIRFRQNLDPKRPRVLLSRDEIQTILIHLKEYSPTFLYPFIYLKVHTGCRRGEAQKLEWEDIDCKTRLIRFRHTKNGSSRQIRISNRLSEFLSQHPKKSHYVFTDEKGFQIGRGKLQRRLISFKRAHPGAKDWRCHDLRHSFAYNFLKRGGEMYQLKAILGHKTIQMT
ncbi:MAG: site-specific integrase [Bdellovibrionota bacterium]